MLTSFRQLIDDNTAEIEALYILYSRPYRAGLRYNEVKELVKAIQQPPYLLQYERLRQAFETVEPYKLREHGSKQLVDAIALVPHAINPKTTLATIGLTVAERQRPWPADQTAKTSTFTPGHWRWLDANKDYVATSPSIDQDDLDEVQIGGLGRAYEHFGETLPALLNELNARLAA